jgi:hypothetical protein
VLLSTTRWYLERISEPITATIQSLSQLIFAVQTLKMPVVESNLDIFNGLHNTRSRCPGQQPKSACRLIRTAKSVHKGPSPLSYVAHSPVRCSSPLSVEGSDRQHTCKTVKTFSASRGNALYGIGCAAPSRRSIPAEDWNAIRRQ